MQCHCINICFDRYREISLKTVSYAGEVMEVRDREGKIYVSQAKLCLRSFTSKRADTIYKGIVKCVSASYGFDLYSVVSSTAVFGTGDKERKEGMKWVGENVIKETAVFVVEQFASTVKFGAIFLLEAFLEEDVDFCNCVMVRTIHGDAVTDAGEDDGLKDRVNIVRWFIVEFEVPNRKKRNL